jgi:hypothetical protein
VNSGIETGFDVIFQFSHKNHDRINRMNRIQVAAGESCFGGTPKIAGETPALPDKNAAASRHGFFLH